MTQQTSAPNKETMRLGLILGGIAFVVALMLSVVNAVASPIIEENLRKQEAIAFSTLFPEATSFEEASPGNPELIPSARTAYRGDELLGVVVTATPRGYGGKMELIVGFDTQRQVTGIQFLSLSETAGIGTRVQEESYWGQYVGQSDFSGVDAITGASISSKAVKSGIEEAAKLAVSIMEQEVE